jgi:tetrahydromethanopterin S-methyltransferase subunit A
MLKVAPHPDYPPEDGRYVRGNDASPVAVANILNHDADKIPPEIEILVRTGIESGAALSGTIQTENIGFEKVICNTVANPNIRYLIVGGPESEGHLTGEALKALIGNGVDEKMRIKNTSAPHPEVIRQAVWSCYQESAVEFRGYSLFDPGAYPEQPLSGKITMKVTNPWIEQPDEKERDAIEKAKALMAKLKDKSKQL